MFLQIPSLSERPAARGAAERPHPRVDTLMDLQLLWTIKPFATVATGEESWLGANSVTRAVLGPAIDTGRG